MGNRCAIHEDLRFKFGEAASNFNHDNNTIHVKYEDWKVSPPNAVLRKGEAASSSAPDSEDIIVDVDYGQVRKDLMELMNAPSWDDGSYAPLLIRLAWQSSGTYCASDGTGGSYGGTMRHPLESGDPSNSGLEAARDLLKPIVQKYQRASAADIWILAACCAIEHTGGPIIPFTPGRVDAAARMAIAPGRLPNPEYGTVDDMEVDDEGRIKGWKTCAAHIREVFSRMGLSDREAVALICGGHGYGRRHPQHSGYAGSCVQNPTQFSNRFAADLLGHDWMLVRSDTLMPDGQYLPQDVRPAPGKALYIDATNYKTAGVDTTSMTAVDAKGFCPGKYQCISQWVNCRETVDVKSPIIGRISKGEEVLLLQVKLFGDAIRGCLAHGGWVSIISSGGQTLFALQGDVNLASLRGKYRTVGTVPYFHTTEAVGNGLGRIRADVFEVSSVTFGTYEGKRGAFFGQVTNAGGSWALLLSPQRGLLAELIVPGYNDEPRCPIAGQSGIQTMLISDMVMRWDPIFCKVLREYAMDEDVLRRDFAAAFQRLTELGCPWSKDFTKCPLACYYR